MNTRALVTVTSNVTVKDPSSATRWQKINLTLYCTNVYTIYMLYYYLGTKYQTIPKCSYIETDGQLTC